MSDTCIPMLSPITTPEFARLPLEIIGNIMGFLGREDLKACRQVRTLNSEASRTLFRTVHIRGKDDMPSGWSIMSESTSSIYVRGVVFTEELREALQRQRRHYYVTRVSPWWFNNRLKELMTHSRHLHLTSIKLESLDLASLFPLFSKAESALEFLKNAERFRLDFHTGRLLGDMQGTGDSDKLSLLPDFKELPGRLPAVRDLTLGFFHGPPLSSDWGLKVEARLGSAILQGFYPRLTSLTLPKLVVWNGNALADFLERHGDTLKSLSIKDIYLIGSGERADLESCLTLIFRLLTLIRNTTQLENMSFEGQIWARKWRTGDIDTAADVKVSCRDEAQSPRFGCRPIRREVEAYVCHRRENLPFITTFRQRSYFLQKAFNRSRDIVRKD